VLEVQNLLRFTILTVYDDLADDFSKHRNNGKLGICDLKRNNTKRNVIQQKSYTFAIRIVNLSKYLKETHNEYVLSRQVLRSGTSVGALISEAKYAQTPADFKHKLTVALKEANETMYWINLLYDTKYITDAMYRSLYKDIDELIALLVSITKALKQTS
jgi:four helix bundle protein